MFVCTDRLAVAVNDIVRANRGGKSQQNHCGNQGDEYFIHGQTSLELPFNTSLDQSTEHRLNSLFQM
jgi:hypothetical protein